MKDIKIMLADLSDKIEGLVNAQDIKYKLAELHVSIIDVTSVLHYV